MKKFIPYIACGLLLISGWACTRTDDLDVVGVEQGKIVIRTALDPQVETRVVADSAAERKITRIDVVVVDPANNTIVHREVHEKADGLNNFSDDNGNGTLTLKKERNTFVEDKAYNIYLIANASKAIADKIAAETTTTLDDLKRLVQEDYTSTTANGVTTFSTLLHLSGTTTPEATAPQTFLMDAVVTQSKGSEVRNIVLYNGVQTENTSVYAEFKRAAAKVIINIKQGSSVEFMRKLELTGDQNDGVAITGNAQYEFYNLPTETKVLAEGYDLGRDNNTLIETKLITIPNSGSYPTFVWKDDVGSVAADGTGDVKVQIVGYADAHEWANASTLNYEPSLLLNLPIMWDANKNDGDGKETARGGNWYKVPLSQNKVFERNTCYIVNITINAIGAESKSEAIELDDIDYDTRPWDVTPIIIGGDSERPKYLKLNTDLVTMYNTNEDNTTLMFASSSEIISVELVEAYYYNKYGERTAVESNVLSTISARPLTDKVNGNIAIFSPIVVTTDAERTILKQQLLEEFGGAAPDRPSGSQPTNPVVGEPNPYEYVPENTSNSWGTSGTNYKYDATTGKFQQQTWRSIFGYVSYGDWTDMNAPSEYTAALEKYNDWNNQSDEKKAAAINAYNEANKEWEDYNEYQARLAGIEATAKASHKNTIRYMKFRVTNKDGLVEEFNVEQYPVIYVQNSLGWYSYRDDFGGTTFEDYGDNGYVGVSLNSVSNGVWDGRYSYSSSGGSGFWSSKVRTSSSTDTDTSIGTYYWSNNTVSTGSNNDSTPNARAYIIRVMSTSPDYTIGNPRVIDYTYNDGTGNKTIEITDPAVDNRKLVAPAFMIASRLGIITSDGGNIGSTNDASRLEVFRQHCAQYVEVHGDANNKVIYNDWRLPTEAELKIIMNHQGTRGQDADAIDYLLNAVYYFAAHGPVFNMKNSYGVNTEPSDPADEDSKSVRCVRDAYKDPTEN